MMKIYVFVSTTIFALLLGTSAVLFAQQDQRDEAKPPQQDEAKPEAHPASHDNARPPRQDEAKPPRQDEAKPAHQQEATPPRQDEAKSPRQENGKPPKLDENNPPKHEETRPSREQAQPATQEHPEHQGDHARPAGQNNAQNNGKRGGHIPDEKFRAQFGRSHTFAVSRPVVVEGQPRFQYSGYWFEIVDPWPAEWAYTDDVYVDYVDGDYFLYDLLHPGVRVAIFVAM